MLTSKKVCFLLSFLLFVAPVDVIFPDQMPVPFQNENSMNSSANNYMGGPGDSPFPPPIEIDYEDICTLSYSSTNFTFYYSHFSDIDEIELASEYYEDLRTTFIDMGFRIPLNEPGSTKMSIFLSPFSGPSSATTYWYAVNSNTGWSKIVHYSFSECSFGFKGVATHEYFHTIQNAYNRNLGWFAEASANWAKIYLAHDSGGTENQIHDFIESCGPLDDDFNKYGSVVFPLVLHKKCGGYTIIRRILEIYSNYPAQYSLSTLKTVINTAIQDVGYNESFDTIVRAMYSYNFHPSYWYTGFGVYLNTWNVGLGQTINFSSSTSYTITGSVEYLSSHYYNFIYPTNSHGKLVISISSTGGDCWAQEYTTNNDDTEHIYYKGHNSFQFEVDNIGSLIKNYSLILTNVHLTSSSNYTINFIYYATQEDLYFAHETRLFEKRFYLSPGQYTNIRVKFADPYRKVIQTLGSGDTVIELYDSNGVLVNDVDFCDDAGFGVNSLVAYNVQSYVYYTIKVRFYSSSTSGYVKLLINNTYRVIAPNHTEIDTIYDIWTINGADNYTLYTYCTMYHSQLLVYIPQTTGIHTISIDSMFANYLFIYECDNDELGVQGVNFNGGNGPNLTSYITRNFIAGKKYLIVFSQDDPSNLFINYDAGDDLTVYITM